MLLDVLECLSRKFIELFLNILLETLVDSDLMSDFLLLGQNLSQLYLVLLQLDLLIDLENVRFLESLT